MRFPFSALFCIALIPGVALAGDDLAGKEVLSTHEQVYIKELGITLPAQMDTGAESASLSAINIDVDEIDGRNMVEFDLAISDEMREDFDLANDLEDKVDDAQLPKSGYVHIITRSENASEEHKGYAERPEIQLTLCIGGRSAKVTVNLTDRRPFSEPLLIGSDALRELGAVVDPSRDQMSQGDPHCDFVNTES